MGHFAHPKSNCIPSSNDALYQRTKFKDLNKYNIVIFNSGHVTKSGLLPTLFYIIYIHPISQVMGILPVSTISKNHTIYFLGN